MTKFISMYHSIVFSAAKEVTLIPPPAFFSSLLGPSSEFVDDFNFSAAIPLGFVVSVLLGGPPAGPIVAAYPSASGFTYVKGFYSYVLCARSILDLGLLERLLITSDLSFIMLGTLK